MPQLPMTPSPASGGACHVNTAPPAASRSVAAVSDDAGVRVSDMGEAPLRPVHKVALM